MDVVVENIWTYLRTKDGMDKELMKAIEKKMSYTVQEYVRFRKTYVDFEFSLFDRDQLRYPTGLFSNLKTVLDNNHINFKIIDERKQARRYSKKLILHGKELRDYQEETVDKSIESERGVIKIATGGGKTVVAAAIIARLNVKTLFIVNSVDLLEQTYDEFTKMLQIDIGKIGGGYCDIKKINICTIQTLHSALGLKYEAVDSECLIKEKISEDVLKRKLEIKDVIQKCEMIIVDEVHHQKANSYVNMLKFAESAYFKFGMSATPYKYDSTDLILNAYSGKKIVNITASYLIDRGFLVPPKIYFLDPNLLGGYTYKKGGFPAIYKKWIVENKNRNNLIVDCVQRLLELDKSILITVTRIPHGKLILENIRKNLKVDAEFIRGEVNKDKRKKLLNQMREKKLKILIGTSVADEGLDLPALDSAIIAGGGKSFIKTLQRVGRTLRPYHEKKEAIIVDFYDHLRYLTGQSRKRMKIYEQERRFKVYRHF